MRTDAATGASAASGSEALVSAEAAGGVMGREILLRVAAAAVLVPVGLFAAHQGGWFLFVATAICAAIAAGEWTRMASGVRGSAALWALGALAAAGALASVYAGRLGIEAVLAVSAASAVAVGALTAALRGRVGWAAFGALYCGVPFGAFVWLRDLPDGRLYLFALLAIVWATDIAAYFAGRGFGGPLLSPKDSPNKTWTGAIGALICAGLAGASIARAAGGDFVHWLVASLVLSVVAQAGDMLESRFKRVFGVKDTSGVIPGHGGVLDRLDALMAATVFAALVLVLLPGFAPGFGETGG